MFPVPAVAPAGRTRERCIYWTSLTGSLALTKMGLPQYYFSNLHSFISFPSFWVEVLGEAGTELGAT